MLPAILPPLLTFIVARVLPVLAVVIVVFYVITIVAAIPVRTQIAFYVSTVVVAALAIATSVWMDHADAKAEADVFHKVDRFFGVPVIHASDSTIVPDWSGEPEPIVLPPRMVARGGFTTWNYQWDVIIDAENSYRPTNRVKGSITAECSISGTGSIDTKQITFREKGSGKALVLG